MRSSTSSYVLYSKVRPQDNLYDFMKCPFCQNEDTSVKDSRSINQGASIRRRRACLKCDAKFTTFEVMQLKKIKILKRDGSCQEFNHQKIQKSIETALRKRPVSEEKMDSLMSSIMYDLEKIHDAKITTKLVGKAVMNALFAFDKVAFVRFASVYMNFKDENAFISLIQDIKNNTL